MLDIENSDLKPRFWSAKELDLSAVPESRVIEQDVRRTRANETFFSTHSIRYVMQQALLRYCAFYNVNYMQGLNEILAPLLMLEPRLDSLHSATSDGTNSSPVSSFQVIDPALSETIDIDEVDEWQLVELYDSDFDVSLAIFERLIEKLSPVIFSTEGVQALQSQLASFHLLLYYFEADLSAYLAREGMTTDIYAPSWFITLFARRSPVEIPLYLWEMLLQSKKPYLIIFIGVAFMQLHKNMLMTISLELLPETIVRLHFTSTYEVDCVFSRALQLEASTPESVVEDIIRLGFDSSLPDSDRAPGLYDIMVSLRNLLTFSVFATNKCKMNK